ncbi:hypothetical protein WMF18_34965 [Sorangium sp. So ce315]|uniref:hypothetical protein n=1 Tax=Sorangium sp. So ce315 TaxID=3133299 RepID=UPI003F5DEB7A
MTPVPGVRPLRRTFALLGVGPRRAFAPGQGTRGPIAREPQERTMSELNGGPPP